jgi:hypothetical protein
MLHNSGILNFILAEKFTQSDALSNTELFLIKSLDQASANGDNYTLESAFFGGMVLGQGALAKNIDGGELYKMRTAAQFEQRYQWRKHTIASAAWSQKVLVSFGIYNKTWPSPADSMNPKVLRTTLENALRRVDELVWFYAEGQNWYIPPASGGVSQDWINAATGARNAVTSMRGKKNLIRQKSGLSIWTIAREGFDVAGKKIWSQKSAIDNRIGNSRISNGIYFITLNSKTSFNTKTTKLSVNK